MILRKLWTSCSMSRLLLICLSFLMSDTDNLMVSAQDPLVPQLFNATDTRIDEFVWFTAIQSVPNGEFQCSGFLIGSRYVVTASHCVENPLAFSVEVSYWCPGRNNCQRESDAVGIRNVLRHGDLSGTSGGDMALLELNRAVDLPIQPAIPYLGKAYHPKQKALRKGRKMTMVGAGRAGTTGGPSGFVRKLRVKYLSRTKCDQQVSQANLLTNTSICSTVIKDKDGSRGAPCRGDSGSAIVVKGKRQWKGRYVVLGVHSLGPRECETAEKDQAFIHFRMEDASELIRTQVCEGDYPEDWCGQVATSAPTLSPIQVPTKKPSPVPSKEPTFEPTLLPTNGVAVPLGSFPLRVSVLAVIRDHTDSVLAVSFDATSSRMASADIAFGQNVMVWDPYNPGSPMLTFQLNVCCVEALVFDPTNKFLAADDGSNVAILDVSDTNETRDPPKLLSGHESFINGVAWHPSRQVVASASSDFTVKIWDVDAGNVIRTLRGHAGDVWDVAFDPLGRYLASSSNDQTIQLWDLSTFAVIRTFTGHLSDVWKLQFSPDGTRLASSSSDGTARVWSVTGGTEVGFVYVRSSVASVAWSPDGRFVAMGCGDQVVRIWDTTVEGTTDALLELRGHTDFPRSVAWSGDGKLVASGSDDTTIVIWEITSS